MHCNYENKQMNKLKKQCLWFNNKKTKQFSKHCHMVTLYLRIVFLWLMTFISTSWPYIGRRLCYDILGLAYIRLSRQHPVTYCTTQCTSDQMSNWTIFNWRSFKIFYTYHCHNTLIKQELGIISFYPPILLI